LPEIKRKSEVLSFGAFDVSLPTQELFKHGTRIKLAPQAFRVLQMLLERPGQLVTREEFHRALWSADTFVDFDQGLNNAVKKIRDALNDSAETPRFVETLPKLGYRFVGKINGALSPIGPNGMATDSDIEDGLAGQSNFNGHERYGLEFDGLRAESSLPVAQIEPSGAVRRIGTDVAQEGSTARKGRKELIAGAAVTLAVVAGIAGWYGLNRRGATKAPLEFVPFTTMPGSENAPSFSPDGEDVAFDYLSDAGWIIYRKRLDGERMVQLTESPDLSSCPSWSPNGKLIAYLKGTEASSLRVRTGIYLMNPLGGEKRRLLDVSNVSCHVSWSPDSKTLVYGPSWSPSQAAGLFLVDIDNPVPRRLLTSPANSVDASPSYSHDGKWIVFARNTSLGVKDLYVVASSGGEARRLTHIDANMGGPVWTSDDRRIIFWSGSGWTTSLYSVSAMGGTPQRLQLLPHNSGSPTISQDGSKLMFVQGQFDPNIWRIDLSRKASRAERFISSTWFEAAPDISADGKRIAFLSSRDGTQAIWISGFDGYSPRRVDLRGANGDEFPRLPNIPRWAPSGDLIAFDALVGGHRQIFVVDSDGGIAQQVTAGEFESQVPTWSADGEWVYFGSDRGGGYEVWKTSIKTHETRQVTHAGGYFGQESADGNLVFFSKPEKEMATWTYIVPGLYAIGRNGGAERLVIPNANWFWRATKRGVYFTDNDAKPHPALKLFHPETGAVETLATLDKESWGNPGGIATSPEGKTFLYTQIDAEGRDLMLVRNGAW